MRVGKFGLLIRFKKLASVNLWSARFFLYFLEQKDVKSSAQTLTVIFQPNGSTGWHKLGFSRRNNIRIYSRETAKLLSLATLLCFIYFPRPLRHRLFFSCRRTSRKLIYTGPASIYIWTLHNEFQSCRYLVVQEFWTNWQIFFKQCREF